MQVILLEKIRRLGNLGDKVKVKPGYGRNYLIPQGKAVFATELNLVIFEKKRVALETKAHEALSYAEQRATILNETSIVIAAQASDEGKLYGSVGINDIMEALLAKSLEVSRREIMLPNGPLHSIGQFIVEVHVHSDVIAQLQLEIVSAQ